MQATAEALKVHQKAGRLKHAIPLPTTAAKSSDTGRSGLDLGLSVSTVKSVPSIWEDMVDSDDQQPGSNKIAASCSSDPLDAKDPWATAASRLTCAADRWEHRRLEQRRVEASTGRDSCEQAADADGYSAFGTA